jgi:hypothetical protein
MQKWGETPAAEAVREGNLVSHIKCKLHKAVQDILAEQLPPGAPPQMSVDWLKTWGAQASLKLAVDEKAGVAPGLTLTTPLPNVVRTFSSGGAVSTSQSQSTALAASVASDATRTETIGFFYAFKDLLAEKQITQPCSRAEGRLIDGDLHIKDFMVSKMLAARVPGLFNPSKPGDSPFSTFTYEVTFIVSTGGSLTPSWKLVQVSANPAGAFLNGSRTRTSDLILTLGPVKGDVPSADVQNAHLADLIGRAVAQSIASRQP